jgi:hypothetical protein
MPIELVPLRNVTAQLAPPIPIENGPMGNRMIVEVLSADMDGERLRAHMKGQAAADWLVVDRLRPIQREARHAPVP